MRPVRLAVAACCLIVSLPVGAAPTGGPILPPGVIYHFGQHDPLVEDAKAGTVPQAAWDKFIMGESSTFKLLPFRRGLYGTDHPAFGDGFGPWFMAIHLKAECREPDAVLVPSDLYADARLSAWFASGPAAPIRDLAAFQNQCFREPSALDSVPGRHLLDVQNVARKGEVGVEGPCEKTVQQFFIDTNPRVVLDEQWMEQRFIGLNIVNHLSWYIRDRDCIAGIEGQEADVVHMMARVHDLWGDQIVRRAIDYEGDEVVDESPKSIERADALRMLLIALARSPGSASNEDLATIRRDAARGYKELSPLGRGAGVYVPPIVDAFMRCRKASRMPDFEGAVPPEDFDVTAIPDIVGKLQAVCVK